MKITYDWLKDHLKISAKEDKLLEKLTDIGLEVESIENLSEGLDLFKVAKIEMKVMGLLSCRHPNMQKILEKVIFLNQVLILSIYQLHQIDQTVLVFGG